MDYKKLGKIIKERRIFLMETQENVASFADVSVTFISNIENYKADKIDLDKLYQICKCLNLDIFTLIEESFKDC